MEIFEIIKDRIILIIGGAVSAIVSFILKQQFSVWSEKRKINRDTKETSSKVQQEAAKQLQEEEQAANSYREKLVWEIRGLRILDMVHSLDLENTYVQLSIQEETSRRYTNIDQISTSIYDDPNLLYQLSQEKNITDNIKSLRPDEALQKYRHMIVLGDPGAGKTTMLRYLCLLSVKNRLDNLPDFPLFVALNRYASANRTDLLEFIFKEISDRYGFPQLHHYIENRLEEGSVIVLLDGLDEVMVGSPEAAESLYRYTASEINKLAVRYPKCPIVVTSRRAGWKGFLAPTFQIMAVLDFTWDDIVRFINNWFDYGSNRARQLQTVLSNQVRMQALAANPLLLSLIAIVFEKDLELPERRAKLYERCVQVLLTEWDAHRGIKRAASFTTDRKRDLLEEIAIDFHQQGLRYFPKAELLEIIAEFLPTVNLPREDAPLILDEITAQHGLLKEQAVDVYGFLHLTLQEYITAVNISHHNDLDIALKHLHNPWWEEVILLLAGMLRDATTLLNSILANEDDIFFNNLLLAGRCLAGTPRIRQLGLRDRITEELKALTENERFHWLPRTQAIKVFSEADGENSSLYLESLICNPQLNWQVAASAAEAIGVFGTKSIASDLVAFLADEQIHPSVRERVADALINLCDEPLVPDLLKLVTDTNINRKVRDRIVRTVGRLGYESAVPSLLKILLEDQSDWVVGRTLSHSSFAKEPERILPLLKNNGLTELARWGLSRAILEWNETQIFSAIECLTDESIDKSVRWSIARHLSDHKDGKLFLYKMKELYADRSLERSIRAMLGRAIFVLGDIEIINELKAILADKQVNDYRLKVDSFEDRMEFD